MIYPEFQFDENNYPLPKAGVYLLLCIPTKKWYVGISKNILIRLWDHASEVKGSSGHKIYNAIQEFTVKNFIARPVFYLTSGSRSDLLDIETQYIKELDSVQSGYNIQITSKSGQGYGKLFSEGITQALSKPDTKAKHLLAINRIARDPRINVIRANAVRLANTGYLHITNGIANANIRQGAAIPENWWRGTTFRRKPPGRPLGSKNKKTLPVYLPIRPN